jgi:hypothetical protein
MGVVPVRMEYVPVYSDLTLSNQTGPPVGGSQWDHLLVFRIRCKGRAWYPLLYKLSLYAFYVPSHSVACVTGLETHLGLIGNTRARA